MSKFKRILTLALIATVLVIGSQATYAYDDDVNYPRSIIIPVVTE